MTGQDHNRPRSLTFYKLWALSDLLPVEFSSPFLPMNLCHFHVDKLGFSGQVFPSPLLPFSPGLLILYHKILGGGWQVGADTRAHSRDLGPQGKKTSVPTSPSFHVPLHSHQRTKPCRGQGFEDTLPYPGPHRLAPCPMPCFLTCGPPSPAVHSRASAWQGQCPRMSNLTQTWCIAALNSAKAVRGRGEMELASDGRQGATPTLLGLTHQEDIG